LLAIRERKLPLPAAAALLSPWVDLEGTGESLNGGVSDDPMVRKDLVALMAPAYLNGASARQPLASPLQADLRGLPPLLIQVGRREVLLDDSTRFALAARRAGVEVELEVWPGMIHVWQIFASELEEGREAIARIGAFLRKHFG
jgi:acetyl esterase/lipase